MIGTVSLCPEDLFAVEFRDVPGKGVVAARSLRFQDNEQALRRRYGAVLQNVSLNVLLGEAALWVLWPSTIAIWTFPLLLWRLSIDIAILAAIGVFLAIQITHMMFYRRWLNYAAFVLANRALQVVAYAVCAGLFWSHGTPRKAIAAAVWLALIAAGMVQVIFVVPFLPVLKSFFAQRPADQALQNVARYHERHRAVL